MPDNTTTFIATGDSFITRRLPEEGYPGFEQIQNVISSHDVGFNNLEMTFHNNEGTPAAESGGTWAMTEPEKLDDILAYGFNLFTTANNHTGDYGEGGVLATIAHVQEREMVFSGTGRNLAEASRACYLETANARVALISACSSFHPAAMAGGQSFEIGGRPGLNPLRFETEYHLTEDYYDMLKQLSKVTDINAKEDYAISTGYANPKPEGTAAFGSYTFKLDEENKIVSSPLEKDMKRIETEIQEATLQSDFVMVSIHSHETDRQDQSVPAMFLEIFARRCIDAGAKVVVGHGPHLLRGIEKYKDGIIFYSLGNFIFETETIALQPFEAFDNKNLPPETKVGAYMSKRSKNGTVGYPANPEIWRAVMAAWTTTDGKITGVQLYPISLGMKQPRSRRGIPVLEEGGDTLEYLAKLSKPYGTEITIENNIGYIKF